MPTPPQLDYARRPALRQRIRARAGVLCVTVALIIITILAGYRWGPHYWARAKLLHYQRLCMEYTPPAGQMVYNEYPGAQVVLPPDEHYLCIDRTAPSSGYGRPPQLALVHTPAPWARFNAAAQPAAAPASTPTPGIGRGIVFLHGRRSHAGHEMLVYVDLTTSAYGIRLGAGAVTPGTWADEPDLRTSAVRPMQVIHDFNVQPIRLTAGRADPNDSSHFTIDATAGSIAETIDGWLEDDDTVTMKPRHGWLDPLDSENAPTLDWHVDDYATKLVDCTDPEMRLTPPGGTWDTRLFPLAPFPRGQRIAFSPDGSLLAGVDGGRVNLWDLHETRNTRSLASKPSLHLWQVVFSPDGRLVAAGGGSPKADADMHEWHPQEWDGQVCVWDVASGKLLHVLRNLRPSMAYLQISLNGQVLSQPEQYADWDLATGTRLVTPTSSDTSSVSQTTPSLRTKYAQVGTDNYGLSLWGGPHDFRADFAMLDFSRDDKLLVYVGDLGQGVSLAHPYGNIFLTRLIPHGHPKPAWCQISPAGSAMAAAPYSTGSNAYVWNLPGADTVWRLNCPNENFIAGLAFSPDGRRLAVANPPGPVLIWKLDDSLVKPASPVTKPAAH